MDQELLEGLKELLHEMNTRQLRAINEQRIVSVALAHLVPALSPKSTRDALLHGMDTARQKMNTPLAEYRPAAAPEVAEERVAKPPPKKPMATAQAGFDDILLASRKELIAKLLEQGRTQEDWQGKSVQALRDMLAALAVIPASRPAPPRLATGPVTHRIKLIRRKAH